MSFLTVFSEIGFPHAGTLLEYASGQREWLSYMPKPNELAGGIGYIDTRDRGSQVEHYVRYVVPEPVLRHAQLVVTKEYWTEVYQIGTSDCVSFARAMAKACGLITFGLAFVPSSLVFDLKRLWSGYTHFDARPFPWSSTPHESIRHMLAGRWRATIGAWTGAFVFGAYGTVYWTESEGGARHTGRWVEGHDAVTWQFDDDPAGWKRTFSVKLPLTSHAQGQILPVGQGFFSMSKA